MRNKRFWQAIIIAASLVLLLVSGSGASAGTALSVPRGWVRVADPGFGIPLNVSVSSLAVYNGQLYAGTINWVTGGSVYRTSDGNHWEIVAQPGQIATPNNPSIVSMIVFNNKLYVGTAWSSQAETDYNYQIWRYDGAKWEVVVDKIPYPVHGFTAFEVFNNGTTTDLYVGVFKQPDANQGASIWRSPTGDLNSWTEVMKNGNGNANSYSITSLKSFNGFLYAALGNSVNGVQVVRSSDGATWTTVVNNGFTGPCQPTPGNSVVCNWDAGGFSVFNNALYLGARNENPTNALTPSSKGGVLYRTTDGTNWAPVTQNGFGNTTNTKIEGTVTFNNTFYAITFNAQYWETPATGLQVWASSDGLNFTPVRKDGFGSIYNTNSLWTNAQAVFNGHLFIGTSNKQDNHGGELFMSTDTVIYLPSTMR